jgi:hypothetical protein
LCAVSSRELESTQASTTLQRVVEKRSGDRPPWATASGVTGGDHVIYAIVRQAETHHG